MDQCKREATGFFLYGVIAARRIEEHCMPIAPKLAMHSSLSLCDMPTCPSVLVTVTTRGTSSPICMLLLVMTVNEGDDESATRTDATSQKRNQSMRAKLLYHMSHKKGVVRMGVHALYINMACQR